MTASCVPTEHAGTTRDDISSNSTSRRVSVSSVASGTIGEDMNTVQHKASTPTYAKPSYQATPSISNFSLTDQAVGDALDELFEVDFPRMPREQQAVAVAYDQLSLVSSEYDSNISHASESSARLFATPNTPAAGMQSVLSPHMSAVSSPAVLAHLVHRIQHCSDSSESKLRGFSTNTSLTVFGLDWRHDTERDGETLTSQRLAAQLLLSSPGMVATIFV